MTNISMIQHSCNNNQQRFGEIDRESRVFFVLKKAREEIFLILE